MPQFGKRNLVMLVAIKIFVIGLLLSGCQEGTSKSPVSALFTSEDLYGEGGSKEEIFNNGTLTGRIAKELTGKGRNGLYVFLYEWGKTTKTLGATTEIDYELGDLIATATTYDTASTTGLETDSGGNFKFTGLPAGKYYLYFGNTAAEPVTTNKARPPSLFSWKEFETDPVIAPNYVHSVKNIDIANFRELSIFTTY